MNKLGTIEKQSLSDQAIIKIRARILSGQIPAGTHLIGETLAKELGISRTPVREALSKLVSMGLIKYDGNSYSIASYTARDIKELYAIRIVLERFAIFETFKHLTTAQVASFRNTCERAANRLNTVGESMDVMIKVDNELHQFFYRGCQNSRLKSILDDIQEKISLIHKWGYVTKKVEYSESAKIDEYMEFLSCLEAHDADMTADLMKRHLVAGEQHTLVCMGFNTKEN